MADFGAISIQEAVEPCELEAIRILFLEYAETLDFSLCFQGFDDELANLPGKYAPPGGCLLLASDSVGGVAGCVGVRPIGEADAEMKRLYVRPEYRSLSLGKRLADAAVSFARDAGYNALCLDTISEKMVAAERLYREMGFVETPPYYDNPVAGAAFYALDLKG